MTTTKDAEQRMSCFIGVSNIRLAIYRAGRQDVAADREITGRAVLGDLVRLLKLALEAGDTALRVTTYRLMVLAAEALRLPHQIATDWGRAHGAGAECDIPRCTVCGKEWTAGDWTLGDFENAEFIAGEPFLICDETCMSVVEKARLPFYTSFASQAAVIAYLMALTVEQKAQRLQLEQMVKRRPTGEVFQ